jgi:lysophospholipase L1-like esterase
MEVNALDGIRRVCKGVSMGTKPSWSPRWVTATDMAIALAMTAALLAWLYDPLSWQTDLVRLRIRWDARPVLAVLFLLGLRAAVTRRTLAAARPRLLPRINLGLGMTLALLVLIESVLRLAGVPPGEPVFVVRGSTGPPVRADGSMVADADLLWRFAPGKVFNGRRVNQLGFLDREVDAAKPPGVRRVVCLGDSCSAQGEPPYSGYIHALLTSRPDAAAAPREAFNAAVHGYTVLQGLALYRQRISSLDPDLVTIYFGWNDHWLADEADAARLARTGSPAWTALRNAVGRKRITQLLARTRRHPPPAERVVRVPPDTYSAELRELVRAIQADGAVPVVITAPRAPTISRRLVHAGQTPSVEEAIRQHDAYAAITRAVAQETGAVLCDLAAEGVDPAYFSDDGIHFTQDGLRHLADRIHACLAPHW